MHSDPIRHITIIGKHHPSLIKEGTGVVYKTPQNAPTGEK